MIVQGQVVKQKVIFMKLLLSGLLSWNRSINFILWSCILLWIDHCSFAWSNVHL